ncbi:Cna B-type domain-containing protein [Halolactibacillus sp. JCM 19043]|uniref:Cna B-type domain-containing protein n=1 Tax=Halolactibacillus sp. JCM 19043 TaxID=1460638 RepID=UPI000785C1C8|nr:Cna B-type domain-containing protein [Halolactibacillus sp. JCM 19043]
MTETELIELNDVGNDIVKGSVKLVKVDGETNETLPGVEFQLEATSLVNSGTYEATTHTTDENGEISVEGLRPGTYRFTEVAPLDGYQPHVGEVTFAINFPHDEQLVELEVSNYKLTSIPVRKVWNDNNQPENRPDVITVELLQNNLPTGETLELTAEKNWEGIFENLDAIDSNSDFYEYTVREVVPGEGYLLQSVTGNQTDGFDIQNVETTDITIEKTWLDASSDVRPEEITVTLYQDDVAFETLTVKAIDNWQGQFADIPIYNLDGSPFNYRVEESDIPNYDLSQIIETETGFEIENVRSALTDVTGEKVWLDDEANDRPETITVHLLQNGEELTSQEVSDVTGWSYSFNELDAFDENGVAHNYTVEEAPVPGYDVSYEETDTGYDITNVRVGTIDVSGEKTWLDGESSDRPESITVNLLRNGIEIDQQVVNSADNWLYSFTDLQEYDNQGVRYTYTITEESVEGYQSEVDGFDLTNLRVGETSISGEKIWLDDDNPERPEDITVNLLQNGIVIDSQLVSESSNWMYHFDQLHAFDEEGVRYNYTVEEAPVSGYDVSYEETDEGFDITNVRVGRTEVSGEKTWIDGESSDRPELITVNLLRNGIEIDQQMVTSADNWRYSFTDLQEYDNQGIRYTYTITEEPVEGYDTTINGYDIENLRVGTVTISGEKTWQDDDPTDRPELIKINLLQNDVVIQTLEVTAKDGWTYQFKDIPEFNEVGERYEYRVTEDGVPGYHTEIDGYNVINTRTGETSVTVNKTWLNDSLLDRPEFITVHLLRNGERVDTIQITSGMDWSYTFRDLAAYDDFGKVYIYTIAEESIPGYETVIDGIT